MVPLGITAADVPGPKSFSRSARVSGQLLVQVTASGLANQSPKVRSKQGAITMSLILSGTAVTGYCRPP